MVVYTLLKKHAFAVLKCQKNGPSDQSEMTQDQSWPQGAHVWLHLCISDKNKSESQNICADKGYGTREVVTYNYNDRNQHCAIDKYE